MGSSTVGRTNLVTLGNGTPGSGVWRTCATSNPRYSNNNMPILVFDGGTLEASGLAAYGSSSLTNYLYGAKEVYVAAGGAVVDTLGNDIAVAQPLRASSAGDGGLTKRGDGTLTLTGACGFQGVTEVEQGGLVLPVSYASTGLVAAAGTTVSFANGVVQTQALAVAELASGVSLTFEAVADGTACDRVDLPASFSFGSLSISLVQAGTTKPVSQVGDYALFTYSGDAPSTSGLTLLNPPRAARRRLLRKRDPSFCASATRRACRSGRSAGPAIGRRLSTGQKRPPMRPARLSASTTRFRRPRRSPEARLRSRGRWRSTTM
jgi:autotransporter-associated beta strand protein